MHQHHLMHKLDNRRGKILGPYFWQKLPPRTNCKTFKLSADSKESQFDKFIFVAFSHKELVRSILRLSAPSCYLLGKINSMETIFSTRHLCLLSKWPTMMESTDCKMGHSQPLFPLLPSFQHSLNLLDSRLDLNHGSLVSEATALPTAPQPLPKWLRYVVNPFRAWIYPSTFFLTTFSSRTRRLSRLRRRVRLNRLFRLAVNLMQPATVTVLCSNNRKKSNYLQQLYLCNSHCDLQLVWTKL